MTDPGTGPVMLPCFIAREYERSRTQHRVNAEIHKVRFMDVSPMF
jgi:hypothetical protein